jgi:hypothetical protein
LSDDLLADAVKVGEMDPWLKAVTFGALREGWVGRDSDLVPREEVVRTDYYRSICLKHDIAGLATAILLRRQAEIAICSLLRGERDPDFNDRALQLLRELTPHMRAAIRLYNRAGELQQNLDSLELALEQFAIGVVVLDNSSTVMFTNSMAQRQLASQDGLVVEEARSRRRLFRILGNCE